MTSSDGHRTVPSAGALYPLEIYIVSGNVLELAQGVYRYLPWRHGLAKEVAGDRRAQLCLAALSQDFIEEAALVVTITAVYERTTWKYGKRGRRYVHMEVGHTAQNISLQAEALNLGTVVVGAFNDAEVRQLLNLPDEEEPLCIMPIGRKRESGR